MSVLDLHSHQAIGSAAADLSVQTDHTQARRQQKTAQQNMDCQRYYDGCLRGNSQLLTLTTASRFETTLIKLVNVI